MIRFASLAALSVLVVVSEAHAVEVLGADTDIDLSGMWLFHDGDNLVFASPTLDDRAWELRRLPTAGTRWDEMWSDYGWYRLHVSVAQEATHTPLYLAIDTVREAAEIYVNGEPIARRGRFGSRPRGGARILHLGGIVRVGLLRSGDNVVALRIYDPTWNGGVPNGRLLMGPAELVLPRVEVDGRYAMTLRVGLAVLALFLGLAQLITLFGRRASRENWWLLGAGFSLCMMHLAGTGVFSWFLPILSLATRLPIVAGVVGVLCLGSFFAARYDDWGARHVRIGRFVLLALAAFLFLAWERVIFYAAEPILLLTGLVASLYAAHLLSKAARRREQGTLPVFVSVALLAMLFVYDGLFSSGSGAIPPLSGIGAVGVLLVTALTAARVTLEEHQHVLAEMLSQRQRAEGQLWMGILDATAMSITHPDGFLDAVIHEAARELEVRRCSLVLPADDGQLTVRAFVGLSADAKGQAVPREGSLAGWVFENGDTITTSTLPEELASKRRGSGYQSEAFVCHPLQHDLKILGVLSVSDRNDGGTFSMSDEISVAEVADKLSLVLARLGRTAGAWVKEAGEAPLPAPIAEVVHPPSEPKARRVDTDPKPDALAESGMPPLDLPPDASPAVDAPPPPPEVSPAGETEPSPDLVPPPAELLDIAAELESALPDEISATSEPPEALSSGGDDPDEKERQ